MVADSTMALEAPMTEEERQQVRVEELREVEECIQQEIKKAQAAPDSDGIICGINRVGWPLSSSSMVPASGLVRQGDWFPGGHWVDFTSAGFAVAPSSTPFSRTVAGVSFLCFSSAILKPAIPISI
jgi:hypothetical protein